ncbi:MAG: hypothetical protein WCQ50_02780 [Spirochaetota bacterium]
MRLLERRIVEVPEPGFRIILGLFFGHDEAVTLVLALGLDDADGGAVDEEHIVGWSRVCTAFPEYHSAIGRKVQLALILDKPSRFGQQYID